MKILVIGGGGREHAIVRKLLESPKIEKLYCAPGNGGIACDAECVALSPMDIDGVVQFATEQNIDLVFVAPDDPLAAGMVDALEQAGISAFGPCAAAAEIESSKVFSKNLMKRYGIPTAEYAVFSDPAEALQYIRGQGHYPTVIKADGLALGKGVLICADEAEATAALHSIMEDRVFGNAGSRVVVEEFLTGPEVSVLAFTDGKAMKPMVASKDHKRALDNDQGLNTGGMGTISPNPYYTEELAEICMETIFLPTMHAMNAEGRTFKGCLYFGLMLTPNGPKVIEYNARFGDPETQVVLPRLKTDLVDILLAVKGGCLSDLEIEWRDGAAACVVMASGGYPGAYPKGLPISGLKSNGQLPTGEAIVYHAGTSRKDGEFITSGGRVLGVTALGSTLDEALQKAYQGVAQIHFDGAHFRHDIGKCP